MGLLRFSGCICYVVNVKNYFESIHYKKTSFILGNFCEEMVGDGVNILELSDVVLGESMGCTVEDRCLFSLACRSSP